jgi:hypothetical protein
MIWSSDRGGIDHWLPDDQCPRDRMTSFTLPLHRLAEILDELTDLAAAMADRVLRLAGRFVRHPFIVQLLVVGEVARCLFHLSLERFRLAFDFITIHVRLSSQTQFTDSKLG